MAHHRLISLRPNRPVPHTRWCANGLAVALLLIAVTTSFAHAARPSASLASFSAKLAQYRRPKGVPAPADNPITGDKAALGKALFFDPRLSGSGKIACATCHDPARGWEDGQPGSIGASGQRLPRRTPTILNAAWAEPLFWDGRADTLEQQAKGPIQSPGEMDMPLHLLPEKIGRVPDYRAAFAKAFPGQPIDVDTISKAIASFERTVVSGVAPFDRWVAGDEQAVSDSAKRGFTLFTGKANCASCHSGWRFTDDGFHDIGLAGNDLGRAKSNPGLTILEHAFKTPTLRNVAKRGPYMHDGSLATLEAVIDHYRDGFIERASLSPEIKKLQLTPQERTDLIAFMASLSADDQLTPVRFARNKLR